MFGPLRRLQLEHARQRLPSESSPPCCLASDDVLDVKGSKQLVFLRQPTILATVARALDDASSQGGVDHEAERCNRVRALDWSVDTNLMNRTIVSYSAFSSAVSSPSLHF